MVGDGVAANAALITLGRTAPWLDVVQVSRINAPGPFQVGEHLSANARPLLQDLDLWQSFQAEDHLKTYCAYSAWGSSLLTERNSINDPLAIGWSLDRAKFDQWLREHARRLGNHRRVQGGVERVERCRGGASVKLRGGEHLHAKFLLDASGRSSVVTRHWTTRERLDRLLAVFDYLGQVDTGIEPTPGPLVEALPGGWLYSALVPRRRLVVMWLTDGDLLPSASAGSGDQPRRVAALREQILASFYTRKRIETAGFSIDNSVLGIAGAADASSHLSQAFVGDIWASSGDAAASFDPLSSHGLATALWSGRQAALGLVACADGKSDGLAAYQQAFSRGMSMYCRQRQALYRAEQRFDSPFWRRRVVSSSPLAREPEPDALRAGNPP